MIFTIGGNRCMINRMSEGFVGFGVSQFFDIVGVIGSSPTNPTDSEALNYSVSELFFSSNSFGPGEEQK